MNAPLSEEKRQCAENWAIQFGSQFKITPEVLEITAGFWGREAFFAYSGLSPDGLREKNILIVCGGSGREAWHCLKSGAASVYILDAGEHLLLLENLLDPFRGRFVLVRADATVLPFANEVFDIVMCDHALQHIPDPKRCFAELVRCCKPDGLVSVCVYSYENNFLMTHLVEPSKRILHFLPINILLLLSTIPAAFLWLFYNLQKWMLRLFPDVNPDRLLFYSLFQSWSRHGFKKFWEACFDLLHAPVSYHFKREEMLTMATDPRLYIEVLTLTRQTMWTMVCRKKKIRDYHAHPFDQSS